MTKGGNAVNLVIANLSPPEASALTVLLGASNVSTSIPEGKRGTGLELAAISALVTLSITAIKALTVWLAATKEHDRSRLSLRVQKPDGSVVDLKVFLNHQTSSAPNSEVVKELRALLAAQTEPQRRSDNNRQKEDGNNE